MLNVTRTGGLRILARQGALTDTNWFELLEERRVLIKPHLREMTLKSLGDLKIVHDDGSGRPLRMGALVEKTYTTPPHHKYYVPSELKNIEGPFSLDTRGIFPDDEVYYGHFKNTRIDKPRGQTGLAGVFTEFWGITRNSEWIKSEVLIKYLTQPDWKGRTESKSEVEKVVVNQATPSEICRHFDITPRLMWQRLGDSVQTWVEHRQFLLEKAEQLVKIIRCEEQMVGIVVPE